MTAHRFLATGKIERQDIERLIECTKAGTLLWIPDSLHLAAIGAYPDPKIIGPNLVSARMGYIENDIEETKWWNYLRLTDLKGVKFYIDQKSPEDMKVLAGELFALVLLHAEHPHTVLED